jgi:hypothetical protein
MLGEQHFDVLYENALFDDAALIPDVGEFVVAPPFMLDFPIEFRCDIGKVMQFCRKLQVLELNFIRNIQRLVKQGVYTLILIDPITQEKCFSNDPHDYQYVLVLPVNIFDTLKVLCDIAKTKRERHNETLDTA